jgi:hypothetical protein
MLSPFSSAKAGIARPSETTAAKAIANLFIDLLPVVAVGASIVIGVQMNPA